MDGVCAMRKQMKNGFRARPVSQLNYPYHGMRLVSKMTWTGPVGLAVLLGVVRVCLAGPQDGPPGNIVDSASDETANPYSVILKRNVFGLNQPPRPPEPAKDPPPDLPEMHLTGFMRTGDQWKVLLAIKVKSPDPKAAPFSTYLKLAEGEKKVVMSMNEKLSMQVVRIYADQEKVDVINSGTPMTLTIKDDGIGSQSPSATSPALLRAHSIKPPVRNISRVYFRTGTEPSEGGGVRSAGAAGAAAPDGENRAERAPQSASQPSSGGVP
jgi:hypothetical protein